MLDAANNQQLAAAAAAAALHSCTVGSRLQSGMANYLVAIAFSLTGSTHTHTNTHTQTTGYICWPWKCINNAPQYGAPTWPMTRTRIAAAATAPATAATAAATDVAHVVGGATVAAAVVGSGASRHVAGKALGRVPLTVGLLLLLLLLLFGIFEHSHQDFPLLYFLAFVYLQSAQKCLLWPGRKRCKCVCVPGVSVCVFHVCLAGFRLSKPHTPVHAHKHTSNKSNTNTTQHKQEEEAGGETSETGPHERPI